MKTTLTKTRYSAGQNALFILLTIAAAVLLPQIFHAVGVLTGIGALLGQMFLPMYIPVLIVGFFAGPVAGIAAGALSPLVSFLITGMPAAPLLPYMMLELSSFGFFAGLFSRTKWNSMIKVLATQLCARGVRVLSVAAVSLMVTNNTVSITAAIESILIGLPGMALQILLIPVLMRINKHDA